MAGSEKKKGPKLSAADKLGNLKLLGIAGVVKGTKFSIKQGESVVIGRSRDCDISLREIPGIDKLPEQGEEYERHFHTVSRKHVRLTYPEYGKLEIEDLSSNGCFLDGVRIEGKLEVPDVETRPHELRLGTTVVFQLDWWKLVPMSSVKMPKVKVKDKQAEDAKGDDKDKEKDNTASKSSAGSSSGSSSSNGKSSSERSPTSTHNFKDLVSDDDHEAEEASDRGPDEDDE